MSIKLGLTNANFKWIAQQLNCSPEMVISVSKVECKREPFDADGFPAILFERHIFYRKAPVSKRAEWAKAYPQICNPKTTPKGGYGSYAAQRVKFSQAFALDRDAAMKACSWGPFQELGANYADYGFETVGEFVDTMKDGLGGAVDIFIKSIKHRGLDDDMRDLRFSVIARLYNGAGYRKFKYDELLEAAYLEAKRQRIAWNRLTAKAPSRKGGTPDIEAFITPSASDVISEPGDAGPVDSGTPDPHSTSNPSSSKEKVAIEKPASQGFMEGIWKRITGLFGGNVGLDVASDKLQQVNALGLSAETWNRILIFAAVASGLYLAFYVWHFYMDYRRNKQITQALIRENSTEGNFVQLVDSDQLEAYKARGYKIITR